MSAPTQRLLPGVTDEPVPPVERTSDRDAVPHTRPGSAAEHELQCRFETTARADRFYREQVLDHLNPAMREFVERQDMAFIATSDGAGECDASFRAGTPGFLHVIDERTIAYPEYRGNGVMASLGNIVENPHVGILMIDFVRELIGLHVNGTAQVVDDEALRHRTPDLPAEQVKGRKPERWVVVAVDEAYVHCRKHIPRMMHVPHRRAWGTDDARSKGGDYFGAANSPSPWSAPPDEQANRD
jgi:uncharacterized protein